MVARFAWLCVVEFVIAVVLAMQVFGSTNEVPTAMHTMVHVKTVRLEAAGTQDPGVEEPPPPPPEEPTSPTPPRTAAAAQWRPDDPAGIVLLGTVRLRNGGPADAYLNLTREKDRKGVNTEKDGSFAMVGLQPGEWEVTLRGESVVETKETITLGDDAVQSHDFVCDPSFPVRITIVTADGEGGATALRKALPRWGDFQVAGQRDAFPDRIAPTVYSAVPVGDARWNSERNPKDGFAGTLYLTAMPAHIALLQRQLVLEQQLVQPGQKEVKFVVDVAALAKRSASASLRVLDADSGAPIEKTTVELNTMHVMGGGQPIGEDGRIRIEGLPPGPLRFAVHAPEHESVWSEVLVEEGQHLDLGDIRLGPSMPLRGKLLDAEGNPANGNLYWAELKWRTAPVAFSSNRSTRIGADGTFQLWGTGRGQIAVMVRTQTGQVAASVFDNPPAEPVVLRLQQGGECKVTRPADATRAFTVTLFDGERRAIEARTLEPRDLQTTITMPPGDYTFEVNDDRRRLVQSGSLTFGATPCSLEIR